MKINGKVLDRKFDAADADDMERLEKAYEGLKERIGGLPDNIKGSEQLRAYCTAVFGFFNDLFGEGADREIFGGRTNARVCAGAVEDFSRFVRKGLK